MYKIGELSKLCSLPVKTLRYYDSIGLLMPDMIDRFTGYRYYSPAKLAQCNRITALKALGFSLDEIGRHLSADSPEDIVALMDAKTAELQNTLAETQSQLKRIAAIKEILTEGEKKMFDLVIRKSDAFCVAYERDLYTAKSDAEQALADLKKCLPASAVGRRSVIINYETEYRERDFDLAVGVEITDRMPKIGGFSLKMLDFADDIASVVCQKDELDAAYRSIQEQIHDYPAEIIGAFYEIYHDDGTVELKVPVYRSAPGSKIEDDDLNLPFEDDPDAVGKWKLLDILPSKEQFRYGQTKTSRDPWHEELYFLEGGEPYWIYPGWTRGYLYTHTGYNFKNRYTIEKRDGHTLMFVEQKRSFHNVMREPGAPQIRVYEKVSDGKYHANDIKRRDFVDYPFNLDESVLGKWQVRDFYNRDIEKTFDPSKQNRRREDLYLKNVEFLPDGSCIYTTKQRASTLAWTNGYTLNKISETASAYEIKQIDGVEYLILEWKSGDYQFAGVPRICWYVFTRA